VRRALLGFVIVLLAVPASAFAAADIKDVDTSGYPTLRVTFVASRSTSQEPTLTENGSKVAGLNAINLGRSKSIALVIDRSRSMEGRPIRDAVAGALAFLNGKSAGDRVSVTAFGNTALALTDFSTATTDADSALRLLDVDAEQGTALFDGIVLAAGNLTAETLPARVLIVLTDGADTTSAVGLEEAVAAAQDAGVAVYPIAIEGKGFAAEPLQKLAAETGGTYYGTASSEALSEIYASIGEELERTWQLEYATAARPGESLTIEASLPGGDSATRQFRAPGRPAPAVTLPEPSPLLPEVFYKSSWGSWLIALAVGLIILMAAAFAFASPRGAWLRGRLQPHVLANERARAQAEEGERLAAFSGVFRATEHAFGNLRPWKRIERMLLRADLPLKPAEFLYITVVIALFVGAAVAIAGLAVYFIAGFMAGSAVLPYLFVAYKARKRLRLFETQLPDLLVTMAASLKAGHSFRQSMQSVVEEAEEPSAKEFKRVLTETRLGRPMDEALGEMSQRLGSKNFEFVISAVTIQRQVGGSLAGLFDMVADTVRQRHQFQRKIRGLTAMGRASAYVLVGLPFFVFVAIQVINRDYMDPLYETSTGHKLIIATLVMMAFGSAILKKIVSFKG
jgi:tight adherence protein B